MSDREKRNAYMREYGQRPHVKAKYREYRKGTEISIGNMLMIGSSEMVMFHQMAILLAEHSGKLMILSVIKVIVISGVKE